MVYQDSPVSGPAADTATTPIVGGMSRYLGAGFHQEPDFRDQATTSQPVAQPVSSDAGTDRTLSLDRRVATTPSLEYVFDDPAEGEPGRDRMLVHGVWELGLALLTLGLGFLLYRAK